MGDVQVANAQHRSYSIHTESSGGDLGGACSPGKLFGLKSPSLGFLSHSDMICPTVQTIFQISTCKV